MLQSMGPQRVRHDIVTEQEPRLLVRYLRLAIASRGVAVVQSLSRVQLFATLWTAACQAFLSFTISQNLLRLMSIELVVPSNHLIFCHPSPPAIGLF